ncbi:C2H2 transcription factor [Cercospora zeina]
MSGYYWQPPVSSDEQYYDFNRPSRLPTSAETQNAFAAFAAELYTLPYEQQARTYGDYTQAYQHPQQPPQYYIQMPTPVEQRQQRWHPGILAPNAGPSMSRTSAFPQYTDVDDFDVSIGHQPGDASLGYLSPPINRARVSRAASVTESVASSVPSTQAHSSRAVSPSATEMARWGKRNGDNSWSCAYPGCTSKSTFHRGCDLRKHYKRHAKSLYCRHEGCPQATEGGFSSKKDRARHEAKHNPTIVCEWDGCERLFSRQDNMKDHVRRVHTRRVH